MYFYFRSMRISFVSKVTRVHKAMTVTNNINLCSTDHFGCVSWIHPGQPGWNFPYEHTTEFVQVTEPARLPGSYEEALSLLVDDLRFVGDLLRLQWRRVVASCRISDQSVTYLTCSGCYVSVTTWHTTFHIEIVDSVTLFDCNMRMLHENR